MTVSYNSDFTPRYNTLYLIINQFIKLILHKTSRIFMKNNFDG